MDCITGRSVLLAIVINRFEQADEHDTALMFYLIAHFLIGSLMENQATNICFKWCSEKKSHKCVVLYSQPCTMNFPNLCKSILCGFFSILLVCQNVTGQTCNPQGNLFIFSNYDGGRLTINVDLDIPDIKIGICTYEPVQVTITGPFKNNVTKVDYAGFYSTNHDHCKYGFNISSISGVDPSLCTIKQYPPAGYSNPNGWSTIIGTDGKCTSNQYAGGANTPDQIVYYFQQATGGIMRIHDIRYGCWFNETLNISSSGNCCIQPSVVPVASFTSSKEAACTGDCIQFSSTSLGGPFTAYNWIFQGGNPASSTSANPSVCYPSPGTFNVQLTVTNSKGDNTVLKAGLIKISNKSALPLIEHKKR